ncbi:hypothetical protein MKK75_12875 [Methylobacterium sp. J-030]|uniref:hypothetical protein n=1 Tax=Methylobacterium sp. J-030 TaxID=2836627 RepID=UPI001FBBEA16|nr:hypothetical protein [Methylobacterium sp. J-030]MCJ2069671.1 hypothetical protein [Methylobacterium sp. J-030]
MTQRLLKPSRKAKACANCCHFAQTSTAYVYGGRGILGTIGEQARGDCRAKPPTRDRKTGDAVWPDVVAADWCSAFSRPGTMKYGEAA